MENLIAALAESVEPTALMAKIVEQICAFIPKADGAAVSLCNDDFLTVVCAHGLAKSLLGNVFPTRGTFQALARESGLPQHTGNAARGPQLPAQLRRWALDSGVQSWVTIPLYHQRSPLGALNIVSAVAAAFSPADVAEIASMGRFVSALIDSHSELRALLADLASETVKAEDSPAALFIASFLPNLARTDYLTRRVVDLLQDASNFHALFQPIVDLRTGKTVGFEGLCRFPQARDMDTPTWFREARRVGRGIPLELAALHTILDAARNIPEQFKVAANLSPLAALNPDIQELLMSTERPLVLELTEHERFPNDMNEKLKPLRDKGILLAIDDVGAGFSSFSQILRLRPDIIKLDGEFIRGIEHDSVKRALAAAVVQFSAELGAVLVAESIENSAQKDVVRQLGIPQGQGYFLGRPCSARQLFSPGSA